MDLALDNLQRLICHKTQTNKQSNRYAERDLVRFLQVLTLVLTYHNKKYEYFPIYKRIQSWFDFERVRKKEIIEVVYVRSENFPRWVTQTGFI